MNSKINSAFWMRIAMQIAEASTCRAKVGCILVHNKMIVGHGYVGSVHGDDHCNESDHVLVDAPHRGSTETKTTCIRTVHAEVNAALKCQVRGSKENGWIECYSTYQPCIDCVKILLQIGVRKIYYLQPYKDEWRDQYIKKLNIDEFHSCCDHPDEDNCFHMIPIVAL